MMKTKNECFIVSYFKIWMRTFWARAHPHTHNNNNEINRFILTGQKKPKTTTTISDDSRLIYFIAFLYDRMCVPVCMHQKQKIYGHWFKISTLLHMRLSLFCSNVEFDFDLVRFSRSHSRSLVVSMWSESKKDPIVCICGASFLRKPISIFLLWKKKCLKKHLNWKG